VATESRTSTCGCSLLRLDASGAIDAVDTSPNVSYYRVALTVERFHSQVLWKSAPLKCVLVTQHHPLSFAVQVLNNDVAFIAQPCDDPEEAAKIAERLWTMLVEQSSD